MKTIPIHLDDDEYMELKTLKEKLGVTWKELFLPYRSQELIAALGRESMKHLTAGKVGAIEQGMRGP